VERGDLGLEAALAEGAVIDDLAILVDEEHSAREHTVPDRLLHRPLDLTESAHRSGSLRYGPSDGHGETTGSSG